MGAGRNVSNQPAATALARQQARIARAVTNRLHENLDLNSFEREFLQLLDGRHDLAVLTRWIQAALDEGRLSVDGEHDPATLAERMLTDLVGTLSRLALLA